MIVHVEGGDPVVAFDELVTGLGGVEGAEGEKRESERSKN